ncbi:MAG: DUF1761 domain-containing protein [Marinosulfonomonas sp.]|nr:DUF1761 domain-containing protein [Marinosulfonomonas sp.]
MGMVAVLVAALGAFVFAVVWYRINMVAWMEAAGVEKGDDGMAKTAPGIRAHIISAVGLILVAGMMRHMFAQAGIDTLSKGFLSGLGVGAFMVSPWVMINYTYAMRPGKLCMIDGIFAIGGCTIIGVILTLF